MLVKWICDKFGIKWDVRQAVAVLYPTDHSRPGRLVGTNTESHISKVYKEQVAIKSMFYQPLMPQNPN